MRDTYGLLSVPGGRHPGVGTANRLVPLGSTYLELITVVDEAEAEANPLGLVAPALRRGAHFASWAVRTDDLDSELRRFETLGFPTLGPHRGARLRPDGVTLRWRTLHLGDGLNPALPFVIEWQVPAGEHPAELPVTHPVGEASIERVVLSAPRPAQLRDQLRTLLGELPAEVVGGASEEVTAVRLRAGDRLLVLD